MIINFHLIQYFFIEYANQDQNAQLLKHFDENCVTGA